MTSLKSLKTALRYPGGKSRACVKMDPYFPDLRNYDEFREPFLGGGSVAIHITKKYPHLDIWVNDLYEPLVNFWQQLQMFGYDLKSELVDLKAGSRSHRTGQTANRPPWCSGSGPPHSRCRAAAGPAVPSTGSGR